MIRYLGILLYNRHYSSAPLMKRSAHFTEVLMLFLVGYTDKGCYISAANNKMHTYTPLWYCGMAFKGQFRTAQASWGRTRRRGRAL